MPVYAHANKRHSSFTHFFLFTLIFSLQKRIIDDFVLFMAVKWLSVFTKKVSSSVRQKYWCVSSYSIYTAPIRKGTIFLGKINNERKGDWFSCKFPWFFNSKCLITKMLNKFIIARSVNIILIESSSGKILTKITKQIFLVREMWNREALLHSKYSPETILYYRSICTRENPVMDSSFVFNL